MTQVTAAENIGLFTTVDHSNNPRWFIDFMDLANSLPEYDKINRSLASKLGDMSGQRVLDLGCGTGDDARQLASLLAGVSEVVGVDVSSSMITEATQRSKDSELPVSFSLGDGKQLDYPEGHFDGARAKLVLMHCEDIDATLDEMIRVVRPGGRLAIYDYDFDTMIIDHPDMSATREIIKRFSDGHRNNWSGRQLFARLTERGVKDISIEPHTVVLPFDFFKNMIRGRLSAARADSGDVILSENEEQKWWEILQSREEKGQFFASFAGFVAAGVTPG